MAPRLFTIPAEAPFLPTLAQNLLDGRLIPGFPGPGPLALAEATVYLPTQRAALGFGRALARAAGRPSLALPRIVPLGAFAAEEGEAAEFETGLDEPPAVGDLARRMTLARMVAFWGRQLKGAIRRCGPDGRLITDEAEPPLVAATAAEALNLAGDLAALIDDMRLEGVGFERLQPLVADPYDAYWRITLDFLKIAFAQWPAWLAETGLVDRAERAQRAVEREIAALAAGRRGPTLVAGSTGVNSATAKLIGAVARAPQGAVVLPGLDQTLDEPAWRLIAAKLDDGGDPTASTHPQAALAKLLTRIGAAREEVQPLAAPGPRAKFLTEAMRPADSTHLWAASKPDARALDGVALIEASHEAEEALAIAAALRETLETPGRTAALITPNPAIARRVAAELTRWGVDVENSAGLTLGVTEEGVFARATLAAARDFSAPRVAALLASPRLRLGRSPEAYAAAARALELGVLRAALPVTGLHDAQAAFAAAREAASSPYAHRAVAALTPDDFAAAQALLADLAAALAPLQAADGGPLAGLVTAHAQALGALAAPEDPGEAVADLLDEWALAAGEGFECGLGDYAAMFETLAAQRAPPNPRGHPRLALLGLLEARLLDYDRVILAGLDETVWPPAARADAFLNRQLRADLGLSPPERRIGQTAQDFVQALGTRDAIVTRCAKRDGSPTVASRFLRRIEALAGPEELQRLRARGRVYLDLARHLDRPAPAPPATRPAPKPPVELRPQRLSVTRIETLRRDPYAIYAERILKLTPLPPVAPDLTAARLGDVWHDALETYAKAPPWTRERLGAIAEAAFADLNADPAFRALRWPRIGKALDAFCEFDAARREKAERIWLEAEGKLALPLTDGAVFTLTARADRIELGRDGLATVIDYKTGAAPGAEEVRVGFAPQLTLEAAMLKRGGFAEIGKLDTEAAIYFKLGGADGGKEKPIRFKDAVFAEVVEEHFAGLQKLLDRFRNPDTGYVSRPFPKFVARGTDYDHLARVAEWALAEGDET
jgi:ATP-dependent helicase/nuclease subunit B